MNVKIHFRAYKHRGPLQAATPRTVTCEICLRRLWKEISLAHFRQFGIGRTTELGRRLTGAIVRAERATRGEDR